MKRVKKGFTLAEVLITLAIIGVVAALTIPTLMADSRYQLLSSRIAKFRSTTEDAALAYAAMNESIDAGALSSIILYKEKNGDTYSLKDDTTVVVSDGTGESIDPTYYGAANSTSAPTETQTNNFKQKYGDPAIKLVFSPKVNGLSTVQSEYTFVMTDKGYVMPSKSDTCLISLITGNNGKMDKTLAAGSCKQKQNN